LDSVFFEGDENRQLCFLHKSEMPKTMIFIRMLKDFPFPVYQSKGPQALNFIE